MSLRSANFATPPVLPQDSQGPPIGCPITFLSAHHIPVHKAAITTNFDDFISRSLTIFGEPHIVCDHPETIQRIDPETDDLQIVHVHGTYWFYDCCNLEGEVEARSKK